ncbi:MAG: HAMP domain-containing histidine kinase [Micromonosporaceae bacterium]|nr:HAMP domain-containing histidine kinase [Micromonosporaceae bacterium]
MRTRLVVIFLLLMGLVLLALEIPLGIVLVSRDTQRVAADRLADATRFASLAVPALRDEEIDQMGIEFRRYHEVYGIGAVLLDQEQRVVANAGVAALDPRTRTAVREALTGRQVSSYQTVWPWRAPPLVTAAPVASGGEVLGAVVTISPTDRVRNRVRSVWLVLGGAGLLAVLACVATAFALARWALKPVTELSTTVSQITAGEHAARVLLPHRTGPPELRRLAVSFNEMADSVTEALQRQRSFVAHASHQLRNPLTALRLRLEELGHELAIAARSDAAAASGGTAGSATAASDNGAAKSAAAASDDATAGSAAALTDDGGPAGAVAAALTQQELALAETDRLCLVLDGLLALARAERGKHALTTVDAVGVAGARVVAWRPVADRRGVTLELAAPAGPLPVSAVATGLDQALDALIDNALKFTADRVEVAVARADGGVTVRVTDNGPGLSAEHRRRATEPFWRAADAQNVDGAGLGLAVAHVLVEVSGGRLELLPAAGGGLDARIWLPAHSLASR